MKKNYKKQNVSFRSIGRKLFLSIALITVGSVSMQAQYCTPGSGGNGCDDGDDINTFELIGENSTSISDQNSGCSGSSAYDDQTALPAVDLLVAMTYTATISSEYYDPFFGDGDYCAIWIDFNNNDIFESSERVLAYNQAVSDVGSSVSVPIPATASAGLHRMRVMVAYPYNQNSDPITADDFDPCNSGTDAWDYGEVHDYRVNVLSLPPCASISFPTTIAAVADKDTICASGADIHLDLTTTIPIASGISYQWQSSVNGQSPWTNIGSPQASPAKTILNVNSDIYYRCEVLCNGTLTGTSNMLSISVTDPVILSANDSSRCGPGSVVLNAAANSGTTLKWYEGPVGGTPIWSGATFSTPLLSQTETFYVAAESIGGGSATISIIGNGTGSTDEYPNPFDNLYTGLKCQMLVKASELQAAGFSAGNITAIGLDVLGLGSTNTFTNFSISAGQTATTNLTNSTFETGLTQAYSSSSYTVSANTVNQFAFTTPVPWDGVSNIIIETCFNNPDWDFSYPSVRYTSNLSFNASHYKYDDDNTDICSSSTSNLNDGGVEISSDRPNIQFTIISSCQSPRQAVIAHIYSDPSIELGNDTTICESNVLTLNAGNPGSAYVWNDATTSQTLTVSDAGDYFVEVNLNGCIASDTISVQIKPNPEVDLGPDVSLCEGGASVVLDAGNPGNSYLWSTTATTQSLTVNSAGFYSVIVTNADFCKGIDTIQVIESALPVVYGINATQAANGSFDFSAAGEAFISAYLWDFGDGTGTDTAAHPNHNYIFEDNYMVTLVVANDCGIDTVTAPLHYNGLGIDVALGGKDQLKLFPNPAKDQLTIQNTSDYKMDQITVYNILGQVVFRGNISGATLYQMDISGLAPGMYNAKIKMNSGASFLRKFEIVK